MSIKKTMFWIVLSAIGIACFGVIGQAGEIETAPGKTLFPWGIDYSVTTESLPDKAGPASFRLTVKTRERDADACDSVILSVTNERGTAYSGPERWAIPASEATPYTYVVTVDIPDNDTSAVIIAAGCRSTMREYRWFVTTGDTLEMYAEHPLGAHKYGPSGSDLERAKFTPEQLQKEFDFTLDLRRAFGNQREFAEKSFGPLQATDVPNVYLIRTTIDNWCILWGDWGMMIMSVDDSAFNAEFPPAPEDSLPADTNPSDSSKPQGSLYNDPNLRGSGAITLERVTGMSSDSTLPINQTITYYLRLNNNTGYDAEGITNGFRVYSPDGATWSGTVGAGNTPPTI
ncbi:MAG: hypothetical protein KAW61_05215 [candidate division Zixibacteria bacterium]|nr:hypothetical protein [candidate division Zixibacteria bacterium]